MKKTKTPKRPATVSSANFSLSVPKNPATAGSAGFSLSGTDIPKYYLADVPHHLRTRVLDLFTRRLYHDALELLRMHSINHYTYDDLLSFYDWAPATLPSVGRGVPAEPPPVLPRDYHQPSPEQIDDIRKRLAELPPDIAERVDHALKHESIDTAAGLLWKAGAGFTPAELYEFRKTLF